MQQGDPFELPHIPFDTDIKIAFAEGPENLPFWQDKHPRTGTASIRTLQDDPLILVIDEFHVGKSRIGGKSTWGKPLGKEQRSCRSLDLAGSAPDS